jgi:hypothetical protein
LLQHVAIRAVLVLAALLVAAGQAGASIWLGDNTARPVLRVDSKGNALASWMQAGKQQSLIVPPHGQLYHGGSLAGPDVSRPVAVPGLPLAVAVRRTPDGTLWALQAWQVEAGGPVELHLARWKGAPTQLTLAFDGTRLTGRATFQGRPVTGTTFTLEGKHPRIYVYLDYWAGAWHRMLGVPPKPDGSFAVLIRPNWRGTRYRATVAGPNLRSTLAPDARAVVAG